MGIYEVIVKRRTIRFFKKKRVPYSILIKLVDAGRLAPSASNFQPWEFIIVDKKEIVDKIFPTLRWAGYIEPFGTPPPGKRPTAYIVVLVNRRIIKKGGIADISAAIENILLLAAEVGLGSCWIGSVDRNQVRKILGIPKYCSIEYVIALGYPDETSVVELYKGDHRYWKDKNGTMHIPKRPLNDILHHNYY